MRSRGAALTVNPSSRRFVTSMLLNEPSRPVTPGLTALRPYFLCRTSGLPTSEVEELHAPRVVALCDALAAIEARLSEHRDLLTASLFSVIGATTDKRIRNRLVAFRRDLFNLRTPRDADLAAAEGTMDAAAWADIAEFKDMLVRRADAVGAVATAYAEELRRTRTLFQQSLGDEDFRRGLLVSSRTLAMNLNRYRAVRAGALAARDEQIERGLLRYFTRTAMKATPFATLCAVIPGSFEPSTLCDSGPPSARFIGDPGRKRGFVRLNKSLFGLLWRHLKQRPAVRATLVVELTPTLMQDELGYHFLTAAGDREMFQRLESNEALDAIVPMLRERSGTRFGDLVHCLCDDPAIEATADEATAYLNQLLDIGLLRFRSGIAEQDADWDVPFAATLSAIDDAQACIAGDLLVALRARLDEYTCAGASAREHIANEIREQLATVMESLGVAGRVWNDLPFYEDATADAEFRITLTEGTVTALEHVSEFVELTMPLALPRIEQAAMRHFFDSRYGTEEQAIPLLRFYEDYYRDHFKAHLEKEVANQSPQGRASLDGYDLGNPFKLDVVKQRHGALKAVSDLVRRRWAASPNATEISLSRAELEQALGQAQPLPPRARSVSMFCQLEASAQGTLPDEQRTRIVLPDGIFFTGRGKYFSRFLYMLPSKFLSDVYADNNAAEGEWHAEICADGDFNANLHPRLLGWEISYPTAEGGTSEGQLLSSDLDVARAPDDLYGLQLIHRPTGMPVVPYDLGFLNPRMRPPLYQLLSRFTSVASCALMLPATPAASGPAQPGAVAPTPSVTYRPRISYEGDVVFARRRWSIPFEQFPARLPAERDSDYFIRVNQWRIGHGIPEQVYMKIQPLPLVVAATVPAQQGGEQAQPAEEDGSDQSELAASPDAEPSEVMGDDAIAEHDMWSSDDDAAVDGADVELDAPESAKATVVSVGENHRAGASPDAVKKAAPRPRGSRDWYKPQFIDFGSPLLVKLFAQVPLALPRFNLTLEERLPAGDRLPRADGGQYVTELVMQLDFAASSPAARGSEGGV